MFPFYQTVVFADTTWIDSLVTDFAALLSSTVEVLVAVALVIFLWGVARFIFNSGDEKAVEEGKKNMIWGIIALFVIVSVWGLVELLQEVFGTTSNPSYSSPQVENPF